MFSHGFSNITKEDLLNVVTESDILHRYFNIRKLPVLINSPLRKDINPSFSIFKFGNKILFKDFATKEKGDIFTLLSCLWRTTFYETISKIYNDILKSHACNIKINKTLHVKYQQSQSIIQCKTRNWKQYDLDYWASYGVSLKTLKFGDVYPISHIIVIKDNNRMVFSADKLAYCYVERKDNIQSLKIYQPLNKNGHKWYNKNNKTVWDLWTKLPPKGDKLIITSSRKDALCLWENINIPATSMQGEGYLPKKKVIEELKSRFKNIYILYDNDYKNPNNPGRNDGKQISDLYGLKQIEIPTEYKSKDPSDLYKNHGCKAFKEIINKLINN